ncbi:MAG: hypothetical protein H7289_02470 [Mucilaginibacter sp.]|nr:hypothetical protein [Mucilaginibacter sp.]
MKKYIFFGLILLATVGLSSCKKEIKSTDICLHDSSIDYMKRWGILTIQTDVFETTGAVKSRKVIYPNGYFQINSDFTYNLFSDDAPVNGKWNINKACEFVLNPSTNKERKFAVIELSDDTLILRQTVGHTTITQRYAAFKCPNLASLQFRWDNAFTLQAPYGTDTVFKTVRLKQSGYFKLNTDASYNLILGAFNGVPAPPPATGSWGIAQPGCLMVLDKNKTNERSYEVQKVNTDSLVIWQKDTVKKLNQLRYYSKHK